MFPNQFLEDEDIFCGISTTSDQLCYTEGMLTLFLLLHYFLISFILRNIECIALLEISISGRFGKNSEISTPKVKT